MKNFNLAIIACLIAIAGFSYGSYSERVGAVRTRSTGFYLNQGENIAIGTSTPTLADVHIRRTATSTLALDGVMGCLVMKDKTAGAFVYYISDGQEWATTTAANCGF
jgi:hypothetical protein